MDPISYSGTADIQFPHPTGKASGQVSAARLNVSSSTAASGHVWCYGPKGKGGQVTFLGGKAIAVTVPYSRDYYDLPDGTVVVRLSMDKAPAGFTYMVEDHAK